MNDKEFKKYINDGIDVEKQLIEGILRMQDAANANMNVPDIIHHKECKDVQKLDRIGLYRDDQGIVIGVLGIDEQLLSRFDRITGGVRLTFQNGDVYSIEMSDSDAIELYHYFSNKAR